MHIFTFTAHLDKTYKTMKQLHFKNNDPIPSIGLGTWKATGNDVKNAVKEALNAGFRHIDTAAIYGNETEIGEALTEVFNEGIIKREDVFVTSKLWNDSHKEEHVIPALKDTLKKLQLNYLDLYLIHWPVAFKHGVMLPNTPSDYVSLEKTPIAETWKEMEKVKDMKLTKHIGVSNFSKKKLKDLISKSNSKPEMNQVELHPLLQQNELFSYCKDQNILLTGYSPLGSGDRSEQMKAENEPNLMQIPAINEIAKKHNVSPAQVLIQWQTNRGTVVIPKSISKNHIISNFEAANISLDTNDMNAIAGLDKNFRFINGKFFEMPGSGYSNIYDE